MKVSSHGPAPADRWPEASSSEHRPPDRVIIISDLHIDAGVHPAAGWTSSENFSYDQEFEAWLGRLIRSAAGRARHLELVLNGDVFDFLRVVRLPESPREVARWRRLLAAAGVSQRPADLIPAANGRFTRYQRRYGLGTQEHECVWKLLAIAQGHSQVIQALARWSRAGHSLVVIRGNHDLEWAWPGVRRAFGVLLEEAGSGPLRDGQLRFRAHVYRLANLHIEHGHRVHWFTRAEREFTAGNPSRLQLPYGALVSRYWLNVLERKVALDIGGPPTLWLKRVLRRQPWRLLPVAMTSAIRAVPLLGISGWKAWFGRLVRWWPWRLGGALGLGVLVLPLVIPAAAAISPIDTLPARAAAALLAIALPQLGFAAREIARQATGGGTPALARRYARRVAAEKQRSATSRAEYIILGHSHRRDEWRWTFSERTVVYANPGAWAPSTESIADSPALSFAWLARRDGGYGRHRLMTFDPRDQRCHRHSST